MRSWKHPYIRRAALHLWFNIVLSDWQVLQWFSPWEESSRYWYVQSTMWNSFIFLLLIRQAHQHWLDGYSDCKAIWWICSCELLQSQWSWSTRTWARWSTFLISSSYVHSLLTIPYLTDHQLWHISPPSPTCHPICLHSIWPYHWFYWQQPLHLSLLSVVPKTQG